MMTQEEYVRDAIGLLSQLIATPSDKSQREGCRRHHGKSPSQLWFHATS